MRKIILFICIVVLIFSLYQIALYIIEAKNVENMHEEIADIYHSGEDTSEEFEYLGANVVGWLTIPGTKIDYPVVKGDDNDYYLDHDIKGNENKHGAIFMDYRNDPYSDENLIIYGHHMKDGTMFKDLVKFKDRDFFDDNRFLYLDIDRKRTKYEIFSVYIVDANSASLLLSCGDTETYEDFFNTVKEKSLFPADVSFAEDGRMVTLSTCTYEYEDARLLIHAFSVDE